MVPLQKQTSRKQSGTLVLTSLLEDVAQSLRSDRLRSLGHASPAGHSKQPSGAGEQLGDAPRVEGLRGA